jgi:ABC-type transporter Mla maintaining outer membrane lipid asymmetry permease subunit MlaE
VAGLPAPKAECLAGQKIIALTTILAAIAANFTNYSQLRNFGVAGSMYDLSNMRSLEPLVGVIHENDRQVQSNLAN